ncbi:MAG: alpha/beta hydrolase [Erysipelotrichaceae bacterium]|nr:alpha/beta hydrolase [Erysipelotrichaceae bacterium]
MKHKKIAAAAGVTGGLSYLAYKKISSQLFKNAFMKHEKEEEVDQKYLDWLSSSNVMQVRITSFDGLKLNAYNVQNHGSNPYVILVHGIWSSKKFSYPRAYEFDRRGFNTLIIDQRASGDSEGEFYTYGQKESLDLILWINYLISKDPNVQIILYGVSMGASTVIMATANDLPANVKCIIEDCGFSSAAEQFDHVVRTDYKLRFTKPVLMMLERELKKNLGMTFDDMSPKKALDTNEIPILIIHGEEDKFVPFEMATKLYNHNKGYKKYYPVAGADHTASIIDEKYFDNIVSFIKQFVI